NGRKMSKSLGNTVDPVKVMNQMGADLLRLWVATTDYQQDVRISDENLKQISEGYRKIRNTLRYMLGNLSDFNVDTDYVSYSMRGNINRAMTLKLSDLYNRMIEAYESYQFDKVYRLLMPFIINDLSAFYLDFTKDLLYTAKKEDLNRRSVQSTLFDITLTLLKVLTPIIPHTTSEAYQFLPFDKKEDVYLERLSEPKPFEEPFELRGALDVLYTLRDEVNLVLEKARAEKTISKSMQAKIHLHITEDMLEAVNKLKVNLKEIFMVAEVEINMSDALSASLTVFEGHTCERCWNVYEKVNEDKLCHRCEQVMKELL
ncbi:MAG: class I tRNA ligase family protein, partial [Acholeplasmataceae bacterium]